MCIHIYIYIHIFFAGQSHRTWGVAPSRNVSVISLHLTLASRRRCSGIEETQRVSKVAPATKPKSEVEVRAEARKSPSWKANRKSVEIPRSEFTARS